MRKDFKVVARKEIPIQIPVGTWLGTLASLKAFEAPEGLWGFCIAVLIGYTTICIVAIVKQEEVSVVGGK